MIYLTDSNVIKAIRYMHNLSVTHESNWFNYLNKYVNKGYMDIINSIINRSCDTKNLLITGSFQYDVFLSNNPYIDKSAYGSISTDPFDDALNFTCNKEFIYNDNNESTIFTRIINFKENQINIKITSDKDTSFYISSRYINATNYEKSELIFNNISSLTKMPFYKAIYLLEKLVFVTAKIVGFGDDNDWKIFNDLSNYNDQSLTSILFNYFNDF